VNPDGAARAAATRFGANPIQLFSLGMIFPITGLRQSVLG
jgi:hypothetical protein